MTYIYLAHAPEDGDFAARLAADLQKEELAVWYDSGAMDNEVYQHLQKATHMVAILSSQALLSERMLAALEYARQQNLERVALRLTDLESIPPQLSGILPLNFTDNGEYDENLQTLLEDLRLPVAEAAPELPEQIIEAVYDPSPQQRRRGIEMLAQYRTAEDEDMKKLARDELTALVFRERDPALRRLLQVTIQSYDMDVRPSTVADVNIPTVHELEQLAASGPSVVLKEGPETRTVYLWHSLRWQTTLGFLALLVGLGPALVGDNLLYGLPLFVVGLLLPHFNVLIRQGGSFEWSPVGSMMGNGLVALLAGGGVALILLLAVKAAEFLLIALILCVGYGVLVGWLATLRFEVLIDADS